MHQNIGFYNSVKWHKESVLKYAKCTIPRSQPSAVGGQANTVSGARLPLSNNFFSLSFHSIYLEVHAMLPFQSPWDELSQEIVPLSNIGEFYIANHSWVSCIEIVLLSKMVRCAVIPGIWGEYAYILSKYQIAFVATGKWSVENPPLFSLSSVAVYPYSSAGRGPKLHISTTRRSPGLAGMPSLSKTFIGPHR